MKIYQQGDVLLKTIPKPTGVTLEKTDLLYKGEQHHHRMKGKFKIATKGEQKFVHSKGATLFHEEHKDVEIPEGFYEMDIVREYDHALEESRRVID